MVYERTLHRDPTQRDQIGWRENHNCADGCERVIQVGNNPMIEDENHISVYPSVKNDWSKNFDE